MKSEDWDKITGNYFEEIESPFSKDVANPIKKEVERIKSKDNLSAIDLGCGIGNLIPLIKDKFSRIVCLDFSKEMIRKAKEKHDHKNIEFFQADLKDISKFGKFDYAFAINSVLEPSIETVDRIFNQIYSVLKKNGVFIGVFPALDSDILRGIITYEYEMNNLGNEMKSIKNVHEIMDTGDYDLLFGFYNNEGKQKHYFKTEIEYRLTKTGFSDLVFDKVKYPWSHCVDERLRDHKGNRLFDWFVSARKG